MWEKYDFPEIKRTHVQAVLSVARTLVAHIKDTHPEISIDASLVDAGCLLHDIDKNVPKLPGERHPDASVRILETEGCDETLCAVVRRHPLHMIVDPSDSPSTLEEKIVYLSDKMAKYEPIGVKKRFALWNDEHLPPEAQQILDTTYPLVCKLSDQLCDMANIQETNLIQEAHMSIGTIVK